MPSEQGYSSQIGPQEGPAPVQAGIGAFGAQLGGAIAQLGETENAAKLRSYQLDRQQAAQTQISNFGTQFASARQAMDTAQENLKNTAPAGGIGYTAGVQAQLDAQKGQLFSGITERSVQVEAQRQWDSYTTGAIGAADDWANGQRIGSLVTNNTTATNIGANRVMTSHDPAALAQEMQAGYDRVDQMAVPADIKAKARLEVGGQLSDSYLQGLNTSDPVTAGKLLDAGTFNDVLNPEKLFTLRRQNGIQLDRLQAQKDSDAAAAQATQVAGFNGLLRTSENGGNVPIQTLVDAQTAAAKMPGQEALHDRLTVAVSQQQVTAKYGLLQPQVVQQAADQVDAQLAQLKANNQPIPIDVGAKATALRSLADRLVKDAAGDQWKLASNHGIVPSPLDWNAPNLSDQLATRLPQATAMAQTVVGPNAAPQPLQPAEAAGLKTLLETGSKLDQLRVMTAIAGQEAQHPGSTATIFNQVNAGPEFRLGTALMTGGAPDAIQVAGDMMNGRAALQRDPTMVSQEKFRASVGAPLATALGGNLAALTGNPRMLGAIDASRSLYAQMAMDAGIAPGSPINTALATKAVNKVLGQYQDGQGITRGGLGNHNGVMKLPDGTSQGEFDGAVAAKLPGAMQAAGVKLSTNPGFGDWLSRSFASGPQARTLAQVTAATPIGANESQWDYQGRIGKIQGDEQTALNDKAASASRAIPPQLPSGIQFRMVGDGLYQMWTGSGYLANPNGQRATWNYRTGKVGF